MPKALTRKQLQSRKDKAVRFVRDVLGDSSRADEIADESLDHYAARRKIRLANAKGGDSQMARTPSREDLIAENDSLWATIEDVYDELGDLLGVDDESSEDDDSDEDSDDDS